MANGAAGAAVPPQGAAVVPRPWPPLDQFDPFSPPTAPKRSYNRVGTSGDFLESFQMSMVQDNRACEQDHPVCQRARYRYRSLHRIMSTGFNSRVEVLKREIIWI